jgi:hypothetical protein
MAKTNLPRPKRDPVYTHEGARASHINPEQKLRRSVMACLLWEKEFYEGGVEIAARIQQLIPHVKPEKVAAIAIEARETMHLRHMPLWIVRTMAAMDTHKHVVADTLSRVIQRPDELTEFMSLYTLGGKQPLSAQVKKGLAAAFTKFDEYQLAKYNRDATYRLRDVLFLSHAKPKDDEQADLWKRLIENKLVVPDTWEVNLSSGKNPKATWERMLSENKLGGMALLRNLRNMGKVGVSRKIIKAAFERATFKRVLPFRFLAAAKMVPEFEDIIEPAFLRTMESQVKLPGKTLIVIDVSGSMYGRTISTMGTMSRARVACSLGIVAREVCEDPRIYATAGNDGSRIHKTQLVPARRGFALGDAIYNLCHPLGGGGIFIKQVMDYLYKKEKSADRIIVLTDEQDCGSGVNDTPAKANVFGKRNYMINVASHKNGVGYGKWVHIDGWSQAVIRYIMELENSNVPQQAL